VGAEATRDAFNQRFWNAESDCCFDVVDDQSADAAIRPNQLFAISLPFAVLSIDHHQSVLDVIREHLLTPFGLRTLSPEHAHYTGRYGGGVVARDRAYHQGTVFPWLLGPYVTALAKVRGRGQAVRDEAGGLIKGCIDYMTNDGLGQLCELFDGDVPHQPGGVRASARSVAEILRCYAEEVLDLPLPGAAVVDPTPSGLLTTILPVRVGK
jgi:glycogen debranching enzyme